MDNIAKALNRHKCTGCSACANVCNFDAIKMQLDSEGFYKPYIDEQKCTSCSLCSRICPVLNTVYNNNDAPDCYALMASDEIRSKSSSGGAFQIISEIILEKNGYVCGAAYTDDNRRVKHIIISSGSELAKLRGSKYIMSDMGDVYREIKKLLLEKKYVLFSGTPCQVAGLNSYLGKDAESKYLLTVDLICHGIPSVKAFRNYMRDVHGNRKITHLGFKDKEYGWHASMTIGFENNEVYNMPCEKDDYFRSYLNGLNKNYVCGECPFAKIPRQGDITIGDYWGINNVNPDYNDKKGTSVVLLNNEKALSLADKIKAKAILFEKTELRGAINGNSNLVSSPSIHKSRNQFFNNLDNRRYHDLVEWGFASQRYDVGIVGIPVFANFGGTLTYYALYRSLRDMGLTVALFSRPRSTGFLPENVEKIYRKNPYDNGDLHLDYKDKQALSFYANENCESFVVGSDQLFNADLYREFGEIVTLDWVTDNHKKIAYAASFGHNFFWGTEDERATMSHFMKKFDSFSVREIEGVELAHNSFGVDAEWVLDPVFLCDKQHYIDIADNCKENTPIKHIFAYILDPSEEKEKILTYVEESKQLNIELFSEMFYSNQRRESLQKRFSHELLFKSVDDRLYSLINSEFIIADSFHGICFAIIFNIPFVAILNPLRGATRFYTILGKLGLLDRMVSSVDELKQRAYLITEPCDFSEANKILQNEKKRCLLWLKNALNHEGKEKKSFSSVDITNKLISGVEKKIAYTNIKANALLSEKSFFKEKNIFDYLSELKKDLNRLIICISAKDTIGTQINKLINSKLSLLNIKTNLVDKHWRGYLALIDCGVVVFEKIGELNQDITCQSKRSCGDIEMISGPYNSGNISYISIDGVDYSENKRGLNIVVIDKYTNNVIDSVCFDTHDPAIPFYRYGQKNNSVTPPHYKCETIGFEIHNVMPPNNFPKDRLDAFYCCRLAVERSVGRKIVLWGESNLFRVILKKYFHIEPAFVITIDEKKANSPKVKMFSEIKDKNKEYYVIVPDLTYKYDDEQRFIKMGYNYVDDFIYRRIKPFQIKNRDFSKEPYHDIFMNSVTGQYSCNSDIKISGFNVCIEFGSGIQLAPASELNINCSRNTFVSIGDNTRISGKNLLLSVGDHYSELHIGKSVIIIENEFRLTSIWISSSIEIGDRTTFNKGTCFHCIDGKNIIVGKDVMFSLNIRLISGDGHSIFNVKTGKNINSILDELPDNKNKTVIGNHVWVGMNATLMSGTSIGDGSIIGANSLVKGVFPNNCAIGGNPAKLIKKDVAWSRLNCCRDISACGYDYINYTETETSEPEISGRQSVIVLGGTRFMGVRLVEQLLEKDYDVTIATRGKTPDTFGSTVKRIVYDRLDEQITQKKLRGQHFDIVIDTSAYSSLDVDNVLKCIECDRYIQVSSVAVYPYEGNEEKKEADFDSHSAEYHINSESMNYPLAKRNAECVVMQKYSHLNAAIVRIPFVVECDNMDNPDLNSRLLFYVRALFDQTPIFIDDPDYLCTFVRTTEEADFLIYLAESDYRGVINFASDGCISVREIMEYIERKTDKKFVITNDGVMHPFNKNHFKFDSHGFCYDLNKVRNIGYDPVPLSDWIYGLLDKYIEQVKGEM